MCRRPHHRVVSMAIVDRVIARLDRSAIAGGLDPPRGSEPREVDPQDSESRDLNQAAVRLPVRCRHVAVDHRRRTRPVWPDVPVLDPHCRGLQHHVHRHQLVVLNVVVEVRLVDAQLVDLVVDAVELVLLQLLELC